MYKDILFSTNPINSDDTVNMLVEMPKGSFNKYEIKVDGVAWLDRTLYSMIPYPVEYGLIPKTWDLDEDMLDIMSLITFPTFTGCMLKIRPIGVMQFIDTGEVDDKILGVPDDDVRFASINSINDLPPHTVDEISFFFSHYKELQFKYKKKSGSVEIKGWGDEKKAREIIDEAIERFNQKY